MEIDNDKTLWSDVSRTRYFLLPRDEGLPSGDFTIRSGVSRHQKVDLTAMLVYEISREEAKAWLDSQFGNVLEGAKSEFINSLKLLGGAPSAELNAPIKTDSSFPQPLPESNQGEIALSLFSTLMQEPVNVLRNDPEAIIRGMQKIGTDLTKILSKATSRSPEDLEASRAQFKTILETLRQHGLAIGDQAANLPDRLNELSRSSRKERN